MQVQLAYNTRKKPPNTVQGSVLNVRSSQVDWRLCLPHGMQL